MAKTPFRHKFTDLADTPETLTSNLFVKVNAGGTALELGSAGAETNDLTTCTGIADDQVPVGSSANVAAYKTLPNGVVKYATATNTFSAAAIGDLSGVPTSRQVATGSGLTGGGDLTQDRTLSIATGAVVNSMLDVMNANSIKANATTGSASPTNVEIAASRFVGRTAAGNIAGLTPAEARTVIGLPQSKSFTVETPTATEVLDLFVTPVAITITNVYHYIRGSTSVTFDILHGTNPTSGTELFGTDVVASSTTTVTNTSSFGGDATCAAGEAVWLDTSAISGTPTILHLTIVYTVD